MKLYSSVGSCSPEALVDVSFSLQAINTKLQNMMAAILFKNVFFMVMCFYWLIFCFLVLRFLLHNIMEPSALLVLYRFFLCIRQPLGWRGRVTFKGGTSNYTLPAAGLFLLPLWVRQCTGLSARADSDEFHGWLFFGV
jgi:hypothetical protein